MSKTLSEDKRMPYFAEGIQDEILTRLSKIADLKVISRTSTQHYKVRRKTCPNRQATWRRHILEEGSKRAATPCA